MDNKIKKLQERIKIKFKNTDLLKQAITHKSYDSKKNYEKLEFLGDRVLGLVISKKLLELYPKEKVGSLDKKLASLVNKNKCIEIGKILKLDDYIFIGNAGNKTSKIENKILSDCCESLIGAIYLEKGFEVSKKFILNVWKEFLDVSNVTIIDSKTKLQEYSLKKFKSLPIYKLVSNTGPRHKPNFKVGVKLKNTKFKFATGSSKKKAEQSAANELLNHINLS
tara:strand:- start:383 stop:1051 length:669 start_codon:yes stop_codon:yes gene_type:complete